MNVKLRVCLTSECVFVRACMFLQSGAQGQLGDVPVQQSVNYTSAIE